MRKFVLSASEGSALRYPRFAEVVGSVRVLPNGRKALLVRVDPISPPGDWTGAPSLEDEQLRGYLLLTAHFIGMPIEDLAANEIWPYPAYVSQIADLRAVTEDFIEQSWILGNAWVEIYRSVKEVEEKNYMHVDLYEEFGGKRVWRNPDSHLIT